MEAVAVDTVIEVLADCSDRTRAEVLHADLLRGARGPRRSQTADARWQMRTVVSTDESGARSVYAEIRDDGGRLVADRTVSDRTNGSCVALARAAGAWAQIVLDAELARAPETRRPEEPTASSANGWIPEDADRLADTEERRDPAEGTRTYQVGTMLFLRNGAAATGGMFGVAPFLAIAFSERWVLRPSVMYGTSTSRVPPDASNSENVSSIGGRLDACRRLRGNYLDHRGIELDVCLGGDGARVWSSREAVGRGSVGPSAVLRGELGYGFGLEVRPIFGVNLNRARFMDAGELPPFVVAAELGASVRFR